MHFSRNLLFVLAGLLLAGCEALPKRDGAREGPFFQPAVFFATSKLPADVRRVVVLPIADKGVNPEGSLASLSASIVRTLNLAARFECVHMTPEECTAFTHTRSISSVDTMPHDFFDRLAAEYNVDGVMFIDLTHYSAYPPISIGIRAKLYRIRDRSMLWAVDQTFSAANPLVSNSARRHWLKAEPSGTPSDMSATVLQNPGKFADYVMTAVFDTLPPRKP